MGLKRVTKELLQTIKKTFAFSYKTKRNKEIIFVLSTGRCGSTSITRMFNQIDTYTAFHEDIPELIELSTRLANNPNEKASIFKQLELIFKKRKWEGRKGQVVVHSDHRLWNLVEFLNDYFPNAQFIHLMRNPLDSVQSFLPRNWYLNTISQDELSVFEKNRLKGDKVHAMKTEEWNDLSRMEKCLWYWDFVNFSISEQLDGISEEKKSIIKLETIENDFKSFLDKKTLSDPSDFENIILNKSKNENSDLFTIDEFNIAISKFNRSTAHFYQNYLSS